MDSRIEALLLAWAVLSTLAFAFRMFADLVQGAAAEHRGAQREEPPFDWHAQLLGAVLLGGIGVLTLAAAAVLAEVTGLPFWLLLLGGYALAWWASRPPRTHGVGTRPYRTLGVPRRQWTEDDL